MTLFIIRNPNLEDIPALMDLPRSEGREMGLRPEFETWFKNDPEGFFMAVSDDGEIMGTCSGMILSDTHGYIGMYIVKHKYRGCGVGKQLWNAAISHLGGRNVGLSAVQSLFKVYRDKAGFTVVTEWTVDLYMCAVPFLPEMISSPSNLTLPISGDTIVASVVNYDRKINIYDRSRIVKSTVMEEGIISRVAIRDNSVVGYSCMKPSLQGHWLVAPMYADSYTVAHSLLYGMISNLNPQQRENGLIVKVPSCNTEAVELLHNFGFVRKDYRLQRCYTKSIESIPTSKIFALQTSVFCTE